MDSPLSRYWRDAGLTGLQLTTHRLTHAEIRTHRHVGYTLSVSDTELHVHTHAGLTVVPPGALLRVAPQVWHSVRAMQAPWREAAMYCSSAVARCIAPGGGVVPMARAADHDGVGVFLDGRAANEFLECHRLLHGGCDTGAEAGAEAGRALLRRRIAQWIPARAAPVLPVDSGDPRMDRLYALIASGFPQRMTLESLAAAAGLHPVHLQRRFKGALGFTPHELLLGHRVEYARDLMAGGARVTEAAHAAGFTDQSHLSKSFLASYAVLPGDYRRLAAFDALQPAAAQHGIAI